MATIGILINHYDARNDIRDLVAELAGQGRVVLLSRESSISHSLPPGVEFRPLVPRRPWKRWLVSRLFRWFGRLPRSRENYLINELFKFAKFRPIRRALESAKLRLQMAMPRVVGINTTMDLMSDCDATDLSDIDSFLLITEFSDIAALSRICRSGRPAWGYLYSWDHACKHVVLTDRLSGYLVWNRGLAQDMEELQGIPPSKCRVIGATQLCPIHDFLRGGPPCQGKGVVDGRPYFYFGCGTGYSSVSRSEVELACALADRLAADFPEHLLLVRPYPMFDDDSTLLPLRSRSNVRIDDSYRRRQIGRSLTRRDIEDRLALQRGAACFLHIGTTMGFEGAFLGCPVVFLDLASRGFGDCYPQLVDFARQYHVRRYLALRSPMVAADLDGVVAALRAALSGDPSAGEYGRMVAQETPSMSMAEIAAGLRRVLLA